MAGPTFLVTRLKCQFQCGCQFKQDPGSTAAHSLR